MIIWHYNKCTDTYCRKKGMLVIERISKVEFIKRIESGEIDKNNITIKK